MRDLLTLLYITTRTRLEDLLRDVAQVRGLVELETVLDILRKRCISERSTRYALRDLAKLGVVVFTDKFLRPHLVRRLCYVYRVFVDPLMLKMLSEKPELLPFLAPVVNPGMYQLVKKLALEKKCTVKLDHNSVRLPKLLSEFSSHVIVCRGLKIRFSVTYLKQMSNDKVDLLVPARILYLLTRIRNSTRVRPEILELSVKLLGYTTVAVQIPDLVQRLVQEAPVTMSNGFLVVREDYEDWLRRELMRLARE